MFTKILELKINYFSSDDWPNRGGERRSIESMMSRRFTWFPNWLVLGELKYTRTWFVLQVSGVGCGEGVCESYKYLHLIGKSLLGMV